MWKNQLFERNQPNQMKIRRNRKGAVPPCVNLGKRKTLVMRQRYNPPGNIQEKYHFDKVSERAGQEFVRLFTQSGRATYGNPKASGGFLVEMIEAYPINTWTKSETDAFISLFRGEVRGRYWSNVTLGHLDDLHVLKIAQHLIDDTSRFSDQMRDLGNMMILSVSVSRAA